MKKALSWVLSAVLLLSVRSAAASRPPEEREAE